MAIFYIIASFLFRKADGRVNAGGALPRPGPPGLQQQLPQAV